MDQHSKQSTAAVRWLTYLMFFMFAMTTDSVGVIIPKVIQEFHLSLTVAGSLQYATMLGIAGAGLSLGWMADRLSRAFSIRFGLSVFALSAFAIPVATDFEQVLGAIFVAGLAIGVFKTGALALVADLSDNPVNYTSTMNLLEGFFGVGAIIGPLLVTLLTQANLSWHGLYVLAGILCVGLILISFTVKYPDKLSNVNSEQLNTSPSTNRLTRLQLLKDPYVQIFSFAAFLYVSVECAIYVWMPTLLTALSGDWTKWAGFTLPAFFVMRAAGRFLGVWAVVRIGWERAVAIASVMIAVCFVLAVCLDVIVAAVTLPLSGLFMSILYPTINSKGIGCANPQDQGSVAGIILFFTCVGAALGPWSMAWISDQTHNPLNGFILAAAAAVVFAAMAVFNFINKPVAEHLNQLV